ncbi:MAG: hypothetical protein AAB268_03290 [Elusimicrobiota bacterium]
MSAPANCPGCGTKLQSDWESCPNCPLSFQDAPPEKTAFQNDNFRNFGMPIIFFGGFAVAIWTFAQYMWRTGSEGTQTVSAVVTARPPAVKRSAVAPIVGGGIQGRVNEKPIARDFPDDDLPSTQARKSSPENEGSGIISVMPAQGVRAVKTKAVSEWKIHGVICNLITLKPVPGVHMIFTDNTTNLRIQIDADPQGRYRALLPALVGRGYVVTMSKPGYESTYLDPGIQGVASLPRERRLELARDLSSLLSKPFLFEPDSGEPLVADFYLPPH